MTEVGDYPLVPTCTVLSADGTDVTDCYQITVNKGMLFVLRRSIHTRSGSAEKVYDGTPLTCDQWEITEGELLSGHTLVGYITGSQTRMGKSDNTMHLAVLDADGIVYRIFPFSAEIYRFERTVWDGPHKSAHRPDE